MTRYAAIIEHIFKSRFRPGMTQVEFAREELVSVANQLGIPLPKNLGDIVYTFRYRAELPEVIRKAASPGSAWIIRAAGSAKYRFVQIVNAPIVPNPNLAVTKVPDATPGIIAKYAFNDEQALLARVRYNQLVDIFSGVTCYSLQNHLRTTVPGMGQVETDELYVGLDKKGIHYVFPVQAKGGNDKMSIVQIEQDFAICAGKFANLVCRPIGAQFAKDGRIVLFEFEANEGGVAVSAERHYKLVPPDQLSDADLQGYRDRRAD